MFRTAKLALLSAVALAISSAQSSAPNNFNVLSWSSVFNQTVYKTGSTGAPVAIGVLNQAVPNVFAFGANGNTTQLSDLVAGRSTNFTPSNFQVNASLVKVNNAINSSIATALGLIPLASPASGVIFQKDPVTGVELPASSTLGPVFTERGETIGKHKVYLGVSHEDFHFTKLNGQSLNALQVLYPGGTPSGILAGSSALTSYPATFDVGMDIRVSQDIAFVTYGVTDRLDVSLGLPMVHAAVAARTYNGVLYAGGGGGGGVLESSSNPNCWCAGTFNPGYFVNSAVNFTLPGTIGQANSEKTGLGDVLLRVKGTVIHNSHLAVAVGGDVRFATGDAENYLGTGTTSIKPFLAASLYTGSTHGIVFAPHLNVSWQWSGKSVLGGDLQPSSSQTALTDGSGTITYTGAPLTATKGYLPDVLSWALGSEVAFGRRNTVVVDILGNQIGLTHGAPNLVTGTAAGFTPCNSNPTTALCSAATASGLEGAPGRISYSQFSGAFGYKARLVGNLVFTFNALTRFDSNGLTARFTPLYGLGYSF